MKKQLNEKLGLLAFFAILLSQTTFCPRPAVAASSMNSTYSSEKIKKKRNRSTQSSTASVTSRVNSDPNDITTPAGRAYKQAKAAEGCPFATQGGKTASTIEPGSAASKSRSSPSSGNTISI